MDAWRATIKLADRPCCLTLSRRHPDCKQCCNFWFSGKGSTLMSGTFSQVVMRLQALMEFAREVLISKSNTGVHLPYARTVS